ncbi:hypothetical protein M419DRAFT_122428 [Trichoderma reesei RUT C-30]|uniref:Uncharacterized protein n=1 Tax=Hypocrea jecorina (strain ATCC 56765 / BCRC 32924 / NRRL 11460 / Rut C-30) TaxID=1344414 RepID=A0A024SHP0_HYPJR|nr:hypothetical protein M419DRAFT_122428 [Trichoderma reesei RUT C-30]
MPSKYTLLGNCTFFPPFVSQKDGIIKRTRSEIPSPQRNLFSFLKHNIEIKEKKESLLQERNGRRERKKVSV